MNRQEKLAQRIYEILVDRGEPMTLQGISEEIQDKPTSTIRGRIYDNLGKLFRKIARGVYWVESDNVACVVLEADGRKGLSLIADASVDGLVCDHPWKIDKSHKGGNRDFTSDYDCFQYTLDDFEEKSRVLKDGHFLVEIVPEENADNFEYLYQIKKMAEKAGLFYYAQVPWKKGSKVSNCGRKSHNTENVLFFTKGKRARSLRPDKKKMLQGQMDAKMSGTAYMLPTQFDVEPPKERIHQAEKPENLYEQILEAISLPRELVVDCFAGSGSLGAAALNKGRFSVLFEILRENVEKISKRLGATAIYKETDATDTKSFTQLALF
jgi:DNA modification methylase